MRLTVNSVQKATDIVIKELQDLSLLTSRVYKINVIHGLYEHDLGSFVNKDILLRRYIGYRDGDIYIPPISIKRLKLIYGKDKDLLDIIRHEYGHGIADKYPYLIKRSSSFIKAFGGPYTRIAPLPGSRNPSSNDFVSRQATKNPKEDFAETFMVYLKCKGKIDLFKTRTGVFEKMKFIKSFNSSLKGLY